MTSDDDDEGEGNTPFLPVNNGAPESIILGPLKPLPQAITSQGPQGPIKETLSG